MPVVSNYLKGRNRERQIFCHFFFLLLFKCLHQDKANAGAWDSVWVLIQMSCKDPSVHPLLLRPKVCGIKNGIRGAGVECCSFSVLEISTSHCGMPGFSSSHPAASPDSCSYICWGTAGNSSNPQERFSWRFRLLALFWSKWVRDRRSQNLSQSFCLSQN